MQLAAAQAISAGAGAAASARAEYNKADRARARSVATWAVVSRALSTSVGFCPTGAEYTREARLRASEYPSHSDP